MSSTSSISIPNLFFLVPVVIFWWVFDSIFGLSLKEIFDVTNNFFEISFITWISWIDSQLKQEILLLIAYSISLSVFPTPAKTISLLSNPSSIDFLTSFPLTASIPKPWLLIRFNNLEFVLALIA